MLDRQATTMLDTYLRSYLEDLAWTLREMNPAALKAVADLFLTARDERRHILVIGNGGSAATASHMACDLGKGTTDYTDPAFRRFPVISLSDNAALMTAVGNDLAFDEVFTEQLKIVMRPKDVVVLISASGNSPNLVRAAEYARAAGGVLVGLLGFGGGKLAGMVDYPLVVSSRNYGIAEDFHLIAQHVLTQYLRRVLAGPARPVAFLDRDGVINERPAPHQYVTSWAGFQLLDGAADVLRGLHDDGYALVVVSNQQGIGKGLVSRQVVDDIHQQMVATLAAAGVPLAGIFVCPHRAEERCFCRKPQPGLFHRALNELSFPVDLTRSIMLGDSESDMEAARAAGVPVRIMIGDGPVPAATAVTSRLANVRELTGAARQA